MDYGPIKFVVKILGGWRLSIPLEIRVEAKLVGDELFDVKWKDDSKQMIYTLLDVKTAGGTVVYGI